MLEISNSKVYDLEESVIASGNAMRVVPPEYTKEEFEKGLIRMKRLVSSSRNSEVKCHDNALTGIRVSFDIKYPQYWTPEFQRYHFADIVTSASKMHRLLKMNIDEACNKYVNKEVIDNLKEEIEFYNIMANHWITILKQEAKIPLRDGTVITTYNQQDALYYSFMKVISNCPSGLELFMRVSTNYKQLQNIYFQRKHHKLKEDWGAYCSFIEHLPYFQELILGQDYDENFKYIDLEND